MDRYRSLAEHEGLSITDREMDLLDTMRKIRNDTVHGRAAIAPSPVDLDYATAIVCRVVVEHLQNDSAGAV
jgi:hypothetical protein